MEKNLELDEKLTQAFKAEAAKIEVDDRLKMKIDRAIRKSEKGEERIMKHFSLRKKIILGIACCGLICTGLIAGGVTTSLVSHTNLLTVCRDYSKLEQQEKKLGFDVHIIKDFSNGYSFDNMNVDEVQGQDEDGHKTETFNELDVQYKNSEGENIGLSANQRFVGSEFRKTDTTLQCGDTTLYYYQDTYKIVPPDYALTEEDKKNVERDDYYISYGSDKVELKKMSHVEWEKDGVRYSILAIDTDMDSDQMLQMASELVK